MRGKNIRFMPVLILKILCGSLSTDTSHNPDTVYSETTYSFTHGTQPVQTDPLDLSNNKNVQSNINERQNKLNHGNNSNISAAVSFTTRENEIFKKDFQVFTAAQNKAPIQNKQESPSLTKENSAKRKKSEDTNPKRSKVHSTSDNKVNKDSNCLNHSEKLNKADLIRSKSNITSLKVINDIHSLILAQFYKKNPNQINKILIDYNSNKYTINEGLSFFDFQAFHNIHKSMKNQMSNYQVCTSNLQTESFLNNENARSIMESIFNALNGAKFTADESDIIKILNTLECKDQVKFIPSSEITNNRCYVNKPCLGSVNSNTIESIKSAYKKFNGETKMITDQYTFYKSYITCLTDMLFSKDTVNNFYILKPDLWKLQTFMPELYFYILWNIKHRKCSENIYKNQRLYLMVQIEQIYNILTKYCELCSKKPSLLKDIINISKAVHGYKKTILDYLKIFFPDTITYSLYKLGSRHLYTKSKKKREDQISSFLCLLAFTGYGPELDQITKHNHFIESIKFKKELNRHIVTSKIIMHREDLKKHVITIMQMIPTFYGLMRNRQNEVIFYEPGVKIFDTRTLIIYYKESENMIYILSLENSQALNFLNVIIHSALR